MKKIKLDVNKCINVNFIIMGVLIILSFIVLSFGTITHETGSCYDERDNVINGLSCDVGTNSNTDISFMIVTLCFALLLINVFLIFVVYNRGV